MIKSPYSLVDLDAMAEEFYVDITKELLLIQRLQDYIADGNKPDPFKSVAIHVLGDLKNLITARPSVLEAEIKIITDVIDRAVNQYLNTNPVLHNRNNKLITNKKLKIKKVNSLIRKDIEAIFDYDISEDQSFTQKDKGAIAYRHAERLSVNSCPYCNANFTFTINNKIKCRPQFDHFLKKSLHPYFGLSFYNLIPCCGHCNSGGLKGQNGFSISSHLHPFMNDMEGLYQFRTNVKAVDFLVNSKDFTLEIQPCKGAPKDKLKRAEANIGIFGLKDRYSMHKDIAAEILKKAYVYNNDAIENLYREFKINNVQIFNSVSEIKELVMGNFLHPDNFHKRILSKLTADIAEEFGLSL